MLLCFGSLLIKYSHSWRSIRPTVLQLDYPCWHFKKTWYNISFAPALRNTEFCCQYPLKGIFLLFSDVIRLFRFSKELLCFLSG